MIKRIIAVFLSFLIIISAGGVSVVAEDNQMNELWQDFETVPAEAKTRPLWFWNDSLANTTKEDIREIMVNSGEKSGYFGFGILPNWIDNYLSDEYMELYGYALDVADELGMSMILYDENGWPSGQAGGLLNKRHPGSTYKRLDKIEKEVTGPASGHIALPEGEYRTYIGAVAMNNDTKEVIDLSEGVVYADANAKGVYASSSHDDVGGESFGVGKAFDGNKSTRWNSASTEYTDQWIEVNFGEEKTVDRVMIYEAFDRITAFAFQYFDGEDWADVITGDKVGNSKELTFEPVTASRFRFLEKTTVGGNQSCSIYEMELYNGDTKLEIPAVDTENCDRVEFTLPEGSWKVMSFATVKDGYSCVDYLDPDCVADYIDVTFEAYYKLFPDHFGTTIDTAFYDEPSLYHAYGRTWTGEFNKMFEEEYGYNPITLYPAMWYDIGEDTEAARNVLFGFRAQLYADYIKQVDEWCRNHGIKLTGHQDQEEPLNPTGVAGDLMKVFENQSIPGVDDIVNPGRSLKVYKIVSSAAYNYDKQLVMSESFGAMGEGIGITNIYKDTMGLFAKGINFIIPHAIWHNNKEHIDNPPELSYRSEQYGPELWGYNEFAGRLQLMLQSGRHVSDIAMLYPVDSLHSSHVLDVGDPYVGGVTPEEADYMSVGELLSTNIRKDFTYIHPEVLTEKCTSENGILTLNNEVNYENYKVMIMPGQTTISLEALKKIKEFYDGGGKVIATTSLPSKSAEFGKNDEVVAIIKEMFGVEEDEFYPKSKVSYSASSEFNSSYAAKFAFDGESSENSRWNAGDRSGGNQWLEVDFGEAKTVSRTVLKENPPYRVTSYRIQYFDNGSWKDCASGGNIGESKENTFAPVTTTKMRLYVDSITDQSASIREFELYGEDDVNLALGECVKRENENAAGGKAVFLGFNYAAQLEAVLDEMTAAYDVDIDGVPADSLGEGSLTYIHKVRDGRDIYYFANTGDNALSADVTLRGEYNDLWLWDPHDGTRKKLDTTVTETDGEKVTSLKLDLAAVRSAFIVDQGEKKPDDPQPIDPEYKLGDIDKNGTINVSDVMTLKNLIMTGRWSDEQLSLGDMNNDGTLTVGDMLSIKNLIMAGG